MWFDSLSISISLFCALCFHSYGYANTLPSVLLVRQTGSSMTLHGNWFIRWFVWNSVRVFVFVFFHHSRRSNVSLYSINSAMFAYECLSGYSIFFIFFLHLFAICLHYLLLILPWILERLHVSYLLLIIFNFHSNCDTNQILITHLGYVEIIRFVVVSSFILHNSSQFRNIKQMPFVDGLMSKDEWQSIKK